MQTIKAISLNNVQRCTLTTVLKKQRDTIMVTQQIAINASGQFIKELRHLGYNPRKAYLFGSVVNGLIHEDSDIDLAIWDDKFSGSLALDYEPIKRILVKYSLLEIHTFNTHDDEASNPFIAEILSRGFRIDNIS